MGQLAREATSWQVDKLARGQGRQSGGAAKAVEARRLRGSVDQTMRKYRVWSIEYRGTRRGPEDTRAREAVQRCKSERSSCAKVQKWDTALKERSETGEVELKGGSIGEPDDWLGGHTFSGVG